MDQFRVNPVDCYEHDFDSDFEDGAAFIREERSAWMNNQRGRIDLNMSVNNVSPNAHEVPKTAFRELFQNWRDGIVRVTGVMPENLGFNREDFYDGINRRLMSTVITVIAEQELCGFIRFVVRDNMADSGFVELVNFNAQLTREAFVIGESGKSGGGQVGKYGEGMKRAISGFTKADFYLEIVSADRTFRTRDMADSRRLVIDWTRIKKQKQDPPRDQRRGQNQLVADPGKDVKVTIGGKQTQGKTYLPKSRAVTRAEFDDWLTISCNINGPDPNLTIHTTSGDLFFDESFRNCVYLQGLRLERSRASGESFMYGYNFRFGEIGRDRKYLDSPDEESSLKMNIWLEAISMRSTLTLKVVEMFQLPTLPADMAMEITKLNPKLVRAMWTFVKNRAMQCVPPRFLVEAQDEQSMHIVYTSLKAEPEELHKRLWDIFRNKNFGLNCRTASEELIHRFKRCPEIYPNSLSPFGRYVYRLLCALLHKRYSEDFHVHVKIADGGELAADCFFVSHERTVLVHDRCFDFQKAHTGTSRRTCADHTKTRLFLCDHHVKKLFSKTVEQISKSEDLKSVEMNEFILEDSAEAEAELDLAPVIRKLDCETCDEPNALKIVWEYNPTILLEPQNNESSYVIEIHDVACDALNKLVHVSSLMDSEQVSKCEKCTGKWIIRKSKETREVIFKHLDHSRKYHAIMAENTASSIKIRSLDPVKPNGPNSDEQQVYGFQESLFHQPIASTNMSSSAPFRVPNYTDRASRATASPRATPLTGSSVETIISPTQSPLTNEGNVFCTGNQTNWGSVAEDHRYPHGCEFYDANDSNGQNIGYLAKFKAGWDRRSRSLSRSSSRSSSIASSRDGKRGTQLDEPQPANKRRHI